MNENVYQLINEKGFRDVETDASGIINFSHYVQDRKISRVFIDVLSSVDELDPAIMIERHRRVIEPHFFDAPSSLQWNLYYYFLISNELLSNEKTASIVRAVELDTDYARKRVLTDAQLPSVYPFASIINNLTPGASGFRDLSSQWMRLLREGCLQDVYSDSPYDSTIEKYLQGPLAVEDDDELPTSVSSDASSPRAISRISIDAYRAFPKVDSIEFANVNLIEGPNGAGKTSMLEAIEMAMCGRTFRHEDLPAEEAKISIYYRNHSDPDVYEPKNLGKYQAREQFWYGIAPTPRKNYLCRGFNRFNFFNSDASFRLAQKDEPGEIWRGFESLALGGETTELGKRIDGFERRFRKSEADLKKKKESLEDDIKEIDAFIEQLKSTGEPPALDTSAIDEMYTILGSKFPVVNESEGKFSKEDFALIRENLSSVRIPLKSLSESTPEISPLSVNSVRDEFDSLQRKIKLHDDFIAAQEKLIKAMTQHMVDIKTGKETTIALRRLLEYCRHPDALKLKTMSENVENWRSKLSQKRTAVNVIKSTDISAGNSDTESLSDLKVSLDKKGSELNTRLDEAKKKVQSLKSGFETVKSLMIEIKSLGRRFLDASTSSNCPLCDSFLERSELEEKISSVHLDDEALVKAIEDRKTTENELHQVQEHLEMLDRINISLDKIGTDTLPKTLADAKSLIKNEIDSVQKLESCLAKEQTQIENLKGYGFSLEEVRELLSRLSVSYPLDKTQFLEGMQSRLDSEESRVSNLEQMHQGIKEEKAKKESRYREDNTLDPELSIDKVREGLLLRFNAFQEQERSLSKLVTRAPGINSVENLRELVRMLDEINFAIEEHVNSLSKQAQKEISMEEQKRRRAKTNNELSSVSTRLSNAAKAIGVFDAINSKYGREAALLQFFETNRPLIVEIFKAIHSPNEFDDIKIEEKVIYVLKNGKKRALNTISTGQRTAVAISLFFGMHLSSPMAPRIVIFDDPVSFVDDLNILAFLDFLRELVISGGRQVFFATASRKLSSLFIKKFEAVEPSMRTLEPNRLFNGANAIRPAQ